MTAPIPLAVGQPMTIKAPTVLAHKYLDAWLIGGLSILVFALMFLFVPRSADVNEISWTTFYLAFVVNGPHFFASYWHIYVDNRERLLHDRRIGFAGLVVPVLLVVGIAIAARQRTDRTLGWMVNVMYLSVGWHYVKQIFGVTLTASAAHGVVVGGWAKRLLRVNLLTLWLLSWTFTNQYGSGEGSKFFGVRYQSANLDAILRRNSLTFLAEHFRLIVYVTVALSAVAAFAGFVVSWIKTGKALAPIGLVSWASIYVWYLPVFAHPSYFYVIPFFHSLQYLLFSVTFSWNKAAGDARTSPDAVAQRLAFAKRISAFVAFSFLAGAAGFHWLPEWLDRNTAYRPAVLGGAFWVVAFNLFINIHHYFVDSVIWRGSNPQVRSYLRPKAVQ